VADLVRPYRHVRPFIRSGDCMLWAGTGLISRLVELRCGGLSHASLIIRNPGYNQTNHEVWVATAEAEGVRLMPLSRELEGFRGKVWWLPLLPTYDTRREAISEWGTKQDGVPYDYWSLFIQAFIRVHPGPRLLFCSELVYLAWLHANLLAPRRWAPWPNELENLGVTIAKIRIA
jgi:hypothetical protein